MPYTEKIKETVKKNNENYNCMWYTHKITSYRVNNTLQRKEGIISNTCTECNLKIQTHEELLSKKVRIRRARSDR